MLIRRALLTVSRPARRAAASKEAGGQELSTATPAASPASPEAEKAKQAAIAAGEVAGPEIYQKNPLGGPFWGRHGMARLLWRSSSTEPSGKAPGKIDPRSGRYPYRHPQVGGDVIYPGEGPYSIMRLVSGKNPIRGTHPLYKDEVTYGGVVRRTLDPVRHMNCQDRYDTVPLADAAKIMFLDLWAFRTTLFSVASPLVAMGLLIYIEQRREPNEIFVDRDEWWKDWESWYYGLQMDHHHYSHMLAVRRANKWGYHDVTLDAHH